MPSGEVSPKKSKLSCRRITRLTNHNGRSAEEEDKSQSGVAKKTKGRSMKRNVMICWQMLPDLLKELKKQKMRTCRTKDVDN